MPTSQNPVFADLLYRSGLSKAALADRLGLHANTVTSWGEDAPGYALAYLRLYVQLKDLWEANK